MIFEHPYMFAMWYGSHKILYRVHSVSSVGIKNKNTAFSLESRPCWVVWDHRIGLWEIAKWGFKLWNTQADWSRLQCWEYSVPLLKEVMLNVSGVLMQFSLFYWFDYVFFKNWREEIFHWIFISALIQLNPNDPAIVGLPNCSNIIWQHATDDGSSSFPVCQCRLLFSSFLNCSNPQTDSDLFMKANVLQNPLGLWTVIYSHLCWRKLQVGFGWHIIG